MKKIATIVISAILLLALTGCDSSDYKKATELFNSGNYAEAQTMFEALGDYEDSAEMVLECKYQNSIALMEEKEYDTAKEILETLGDYKDSADVLREVGWNIFADYLYDEGKVTIKNDDYKVTLEMVEEQGEELIAVALSVGTTGMASHDFVAMINQPYPEVTALVAEGKISIFTSYMEDEGYTSWDITRYKKGDSIKWEEYECTGRTAQGTSLPAGTTGLCYDTELPLERLTDGIQKAIKNSNTGISMSDLGFWAY